MKNKKYKLGKNVPNYTRVVEDYRNKRIKDTYRRGVVVLNNLGKDYPDQLVLVQWDFDNFTAGFREEKELEMVNIRDLIEEELFVNISTPEGLALEEEFKLLVKTVGKTINDKVEAANKLLQEAEQLAYDNGLPFSSPISPLEQPYIPSSFAQKYKLVNKILVEELTGIAEFALDQYGSGWQTSQLGC